MASRHLYVLDLRSGDAVRRLMRLGLARWLRVRRLLGGGRTRLAVVPVSYYGDATATEWPAGVDVDYADTLLDQSHLLADTDWARECGLALVRTAPRGVFPVVQGVHFGELNTAYLWAKLSAYANLAAAVRAALVARRADRCTVVTSVPAIARALRHDLAPHVRRLRTLTLPERRRRVPVPPAAAAEPPTEPLPRVLAAEGPRRVLIVSHTSAMAQMFERVEACLRADGVDSVLRLQYGATEQPVVEDGGTAVAYLTRPAAAAADVARYVALWQDVARPHFESLDRAGTRVHPGYTPPLASSLEDIYLEHFAAQAARVREAAAVLDRVAPELVVVGNDRWWEDKTYVLLARQRGIPTVGVQDGTDGTVPAWYWTDSDYVAAQSETLPERLVHAGFSAAQVRVTGQPRFDVLFDAAATADRGAARARLGLPDGFWVLFASQPWQDASIAARVVRAVLDVPGAMLAIRPHPAVSVESFREAVAASGDRVRVLQGDLHDSLVAADVLVTQHSTVAIEAAILSRQTVFINFTGQVDISPYGECRIGVTVSTWQELASELRRAASGDALVAEDEFRAGLRRLVGPLDGRAGPRLAAFIGELLERGHTDAARREAAATGRAAEA
jgi:hypothetical protein